MMCSVGICPYVTHEGYNPAAMVPLLVIGGLAVAVVFAPSLWARHVLRRYRAQDATVQTTGGELARHLLDGLGLAHVAVEATEKGMGDHYDPEAKAVRLGKDHLEGCSLTAVVVAAHEVGHAIQDGMAYGPLRTRTQLARGAVIAEKLGGGLMLLAPVLGLISRAPSPTAISAIIGLATLSMSLVVHLVTLPVELDASFGQALPILRSSGLIQATEHPAARTILLACALTYVAASLAGLLNLYRWLRVWRR